MIHDLIKIPTDLVILEKGIFLRLELQCLLKRTETCTQNEGGEVTQGIGHLLGRAPAREGSVVSLRPMQCNPRYQRLWKGSQLTVKSSLIFQDGNCFL